MKPFKKSFARLRYMSITLLGDLKANAQDVLNLPPEQRPQFERAILSPPQRPVLFSRDPMGRKNNPSHKSLLTTLGW